MEVLVTVVGLVVAYLIGTKWIERKHFKSLQEREKKYMELPIMSIDGTPGEGFKESWLVSATVVISVDFFKRFVASLIKIFGGRIVTYETLLDRARREALLRMYDKAHKKGAKAIVNLRVETSSINKSSKGKVGAVEILVYCTAVK